MGINAVAYGSQCDNPACRTFVPSIDGDENSRSRGFTGTVVHDWETGGGAGGPWFACSSPCIASAVEEVVRKSWEE
jgi:hypothetical protein